MKRITTLLIVGLIALSSIYAHAADNPPSREIINSFVKAHFSRDGLWTVIVTKVDVGNAAKSDDYPSLISKGMPRNTTLFPLQFHVHETLPKDARGNGSPPEQVDYVAVWFLFQDPFGEWKMPNAYGAPWGL